MNQNPDFKEFTDEIPASWDAESIEAWNIEQQAKALVDKMDDKPHIVESKDVHP